MFRNPVLFPALMVTMLASVLILRFPWLWDSKIYSHRSVLRRWTLLPHRVYMLELSACKVSQPRGVELRTLKATCRIYRKCTSRRSAHISRGLEPVKSFLRAEQRLKDSAGENGVLRRKSRGMARPLRNCLSRHAPRDV